MVSETLYDPNTGRVAATVDPAGKIAKTFYDALGRVTKTIANFSGTGIPVITQPDENVTVEIAYTADHQVAQMTAKNAVTGDQVTRYVYGSGKNMIAPLLYSNNLLVAEMYPDSDDFEDGNGPAGNFLKNGQDALADRIEFQYNRAGEKVWRRDQNGTTHVYEYDNLGRLLHDRVSNVAPEVDSTVRRISTSYDVTGNVRTITSWNNPEIGTGNIVNQICYEYNNHGLLHQEKNSLDAPCSDTTPCISYSYDLTKNGYYFTKRLRPISVTYPDGRVITYHYGGVGDGNDKIDTDNKYTIEGVNINDRLNRVAKIFSGTTPLVQYSYHGLAQVAIQTSPENSLMYGSFLSEDMFDPFNRPVMLGYSLMGNETLAGEILSYDRVGNKKFKLDPLHPENSEFYRYDGMNQLVDFSRSGYDVDSFDPTDPSTLVPNVATLSQNFGYDPLGNWQRNTKNGVTETRTHNKANEIVSLGGINSYVASNANGNMVKLPKVGGAYEAVYDGWNRLVQLSDGNIIVAQYQYNGLNHRVKKTVGSTVTVSIFNRNWQELESVTNGEVTTYVWGVRYIDDLVCRDRGSERLYVMQDSNWNVIGLVDRDGTVAERIRYSAFGEPEFMDTDYVPKTGSDYGWTRTFTGQVYDVETGLMLYRNRFYSPDLGRFVTRDPIGYEGDDENLYRYVGNQSGNEVDSFGLQVSPWSPTGPSRPPRRDDPLPVWPGLPSPLTPPPPAIACCNGVSYNTRIQCCEDGNVVTKVSIWICRRAFSWVKRAYLGYLSHSYVCCSGPNKNCYGKQGGLRQGDDVPREADDVQGKCKEYKVCPRVKKAKCNDPKCTSDYSATGSNCHHWAWEGVNDY